MGHGVGGDGGQHWQHTSLMEVHSQTRLPTHMHGVTFLNPDPIGSCDFNPKMQLNSSYKLV